MKPADAAPAAIITGASEGIGRALALALARRGWSVGLLARREDALSLTAETARTLGAPLAITRAADVARTDEFLAALDTLDRELGGCDLFVANAGVDLPDWRQTVRVNFEAAIAGVEHLLPRFRARRRGAIAGVTSVAGARGLPAARAYCASKAGFHAYLEGLQLDLARDGIPVTIIAPGFVDTPMTRRNPFPMPFLMNVDRAADRFARAIERRRALVIAPRPWVPVFWLLRSMPHGLFRRLAARLRFER